MDIQGETEVRKGGTVSFGLDMGATPILSVTAPSEGTPSEGTISPQSPSRPEPELDRVRLEAERLVNQVLAEAGEIVKSRKRASGSKPEVAVVITSNGVKGRKAEVIATKANDLMKEIVREAEVMSAADDFVRHILSMAIDEANRKLMAIKRKKQSDANGDHLPLLNDLQHELQEGVEEAEERRGAGAAGAEKGEEREEAKPRPWYRRARTSVRKLLHRLCACHRR